MKKKIDLTQIHDCNKLLNKCYATLLRPILIKEKNVDCEINGKKTRYARWVIDKEALQRHMDIYKWRSTPNPEFLPEDEAGNKVINLSALKQTKIYDFL